MPRVFRANSTIKQPVYKPKNVDIARNKDASCTVCIPFSADVELGNTDRVVSIDSLSLLTGSSTFNKLADVFDEFKITKYHCCIDLNKPAAATIKSSEMFTVPMLNDTIKGMYYMKYSVEDQEDVVMTGIDDQFKHLVQQYLLNMGVLKMQNNKIARNYGVNTTTNNSYYVLEIIYQMLIDNNVCINSDVLNHLCNHNNTGDMTYDFDVDEGNDQVEHCQVTVSLKQDENAQLPLHVGEIKCNVGTYQIIGACALRQVPKGFYGEEQTQGQYIRNEVPNVYQYNNNNPADGPIEYSLTDDEIESVGNYIHDSYMPGSTVHLSLEINGVSATEKTLYLPTQVVKNISSVDSMNQMGRFLPVGFIQNKVKFAGDPRAALVNGTFFDEYILQVQDAIAGMTDDNVILNCMFIMNFEITDSDDHTLEIEIPFFNFPICLGVDGKMLPTNSGLYTVLSGYDSSTNNYLFDPVANALQLDAFLRRVYTNVDAGGSLYYGSSPDDVNMDNKGSVFDIQAYVTCRFRNIRNVMTANKVVYPYAFFDYYCNDKLTYHGMVVAVEVQYKGGSREKCLVKNTCLNMGPHKETQLIEGNNVIVEVDTPLNYNKPNKVIRYLKIGSMDAYVAHTVCGPTHNPFRIIGYTPAHDAVPARFEEKEVTRYVLYGFACQVNPKFKNRVVTFNVFGFGATNNGQVNVVNLTKEEAVGDIVYHNPDEIWHWFWVGFVDKYTRNDNGSNMNFDFGSYPDDQLENMEEFVNIKCGTVDAVDENGEEDLNPPSAWPQQKWLVNITRMRSYGICDDNFGNCVLEYDCSPYMLGGFTIDPEDYESPNVNPNQGVNLKGNVVYGVGFPTTVCPVGTYFGNTGY